MCNIRHLIKGSRPVCQERQTFSWNWSPKRPKQFNVNRHWAINIWLWNMHCTPTELWEINSAIGPDQGLQKEVKGQRLKDLGKFPLLLLQSLCWHCSSLCLHFSAKSLPRTMHWQSLSAETSSLKPIEISAFKCKFV